MNSQCYRHVMYARPDDAVADGLGFLLRYRGIAAQILGEIGILTALKYFGRFDTQALTVVFVIIVVMVILTIRERQQRLLLLKLSSSLHLITHKARDTCKKLTTAIREARDSGGHNGHQATHEHYATLWFDLNVELCNNIASYFEELIGERTVCCAIRCAKENEGKPEFVTMARSQKMHRERDRLSTPLPADEGVARILRKESNSGVLYVWDIEEAKKLGIWYDTGTDNLGDVTQVMVAPINGYPADKHCDKKETFGLLYVTTLKKKLHVSYCEHLMAIADLIGLIYPLVTYDLDKLEPKPNQNRVD